MGSLALGTMSAACLVREGNAVTAADVFSGSRRWSVEKADCIQWLRALPPDSVDLVFGSPPYEAQRTYSIGFNLKGQAWVDWMVEVYRAASICCRGLVAFVVEGFTKNYKWSATPALLMTDLHRAGFNLRKPPVFHRIGIPGSGGPDWLRNDFEFIVCATRPGKLAWSMPTACGRVPRYAPGGPMSYRTLNGERVNIPPEKMTNVIGNRGGNRRRANGTREKMGKKISANGRANGDNKTEATYLPPTLANPGNVLRYEVGGGVMGSPLCHLNEAPFPLKLASFFVQSFCPPNGIAADCFSGSGTTLHACIDHGRRFIGCDVRECQVKLATKRASGVTGSLLTTT